MAKSKPLRRKIEQLYAEVNNVSVEEANKILAHNKKLYEEWKKVILGESDIT